MRLLASVALALASSTGVGGEAPYPMTGSSWEKRLDATSCDDFQDRMTFVERLDAASALLLILRAGTSPNAPKPDEDLVERFAVDIERMCDEHSMGRESIVEAASLAYLGLGGEPSRYVPPHRERR